MNIKLQRKQNLRKEVIYKNIDGVFSLDQTGRETKKGVFPLLFFQAWFTYLIISFCLLMKQQSQLFL